ncbi:MAG: dihydroneopterin aldolase [Paludibacteraceae bacterium]|nr:dihydroneopterin aldolase [Paludibacteraceae bacterium]
MTIRLQDIELQAYHGVYPEEKRLGNTFLVNISLTLPDTRAVETDQLADTVNYQSVYDIVQREMAIPSDLLEHVAGRIRKAICQLVPQAVVKIQISKKNPPLGGKVAWATIEL